MYFSVSRFETFWILLLNVILNLSKHEINVDIIWNVTLPTRKKYTLTASSLQSCLTTVHKFVIINKVDERVKTAKINEFIYFRTTRVCYTVGHNLNF